MQPFSGNQRPGPPNSSDEHVSCTARATENASLQILFKCPTPAIVFGNAIPVWGSWLKLGGWSPFFFLLDFSQI